MVCELLGLEPGSSSGQWRTSGSGLSADAPVGPELSPGSGREPEVFAWGWWKECGTCRLPSAIVRPFTPFRWLTVTLWGSGAKTDGPSPRAQGVGEPHLNQHGRVARNCSGGDGEGRCQPPVGSRFGTPSGVPAPSYWENGGLPEAAHQPQSSSKAAPFRGEALGPAPPSLSAQLPTG